MQFAIANTLGLPADVLASAKARLLLFDASVDPKLAVKDWIQYATQCRGVIASLVGGVYTTGQVQGVRDGKHYPATGGVLTQSAQTTPVSATNYTTLVDLDTSNSSLGIKYGSRISMPSRNAAPPTWDSDGYGLPQDLMIISSKTGELKAEASASVSCYFTRTFKPDSSRTITRTNTINSYSVLRGVRINKTAVNLNKFAVNLNFRIASAVLAQSKVADLPVGVFLANRAIQGVYFETEYYKTSYAPVDKFQNGDAGYIPLGTVRKIPVYLDSMEENETVTPTWAALQVDSIKGESLLTFTIGEDGDFIPTSSCVPGKYMTLIENPNKMPRIRQHLQNL